MQLAKQKMKQIQNRNIIVFEKASLCHFEKSSLCHFEKSSLCHFEKSNLCQQIQLISRRHIKCIEFGRAQHTKHNVSRKEIDTKKLCKAPLSAKCNGLTGNQRTLTYSELAANMRVEKVKNRNKQLCNKRHSKASSDQRRPEPYNLDRSAGR